MASDTQLRAWWLTYRCQPDKYTPVDFPGEGRVWRLKVAIPAEEAFNRFAGLMTEHGYLFRELAGGTYNCRKVAGSNKWSIHSYGLALDLNPSVNPHKRPLTHDYPPAFITAVEQLRTNSGKQVFQWGGRWSMPDAMHWQINCSPADLQTGIAGTTQPPPVGEDLMLPIGPTSPVEDIRLVQGLLNAGFNAGLTENGKWDAATQQAAATHVGSVTGDAKAAAGEYVNARMYQALHVGLIRSVATGGTGGVSETKVRQLIESSRILTAT